MDQERKEVDLNAIPFWDEKYYFDVIGFEKEIDSLITHKDHNELMQLTPQDAHAPINDEEYKEYKSWEDNLTDQEREDDGHESYFGAWGLDNKQNRLATLSTRKVITDAAEKEIIELWNCLEIENRLTFITPKLRKIAEERLGLSVSIGEILNDFDLSDVNDKLLIRYLLNDLHLMRSPLVIQYIKHKQDVQDSGFLELILPAIFPKNTNRKNNKNGSTREMQDWVFVQIYFYYKVHQEQVQIITDDVRKYFPKIFGRVQGLKYNKDGNASFATMKNWYDQTRCYYQRYFLEKELLEIIQKHLTKIQHEIL